MKESVVRSHYINNILKNNLVTDELHIGGRVATEYLLAGMDLKPGMRVLDVGSGLGAAARAAAHIYNVQVTGIDLVPELCAEATRLTTDRNVRFVSGSALDMDFPDHAFDAAFMLHVNMNIREKQRLFSEIARVLQNNSEFSFYEILADDHAGDMVYPCPWAALAANSFLVTPDDIETMLQVAGFIIEAKESRRDFARETLARFTEKYPEQAVVNLLENIRQNRCAPWQYVCRKL